MNVLLIRFSSLGDIVLSDPLASTLRRAYPTAKIDFLTSSGYAEIAGAIDGIDEVIQPDRAAHIDRLVRKSYSIVFDLQNSFRSRKVTGQIDPAQLFRFHRQRINRFLRIRFPSMRDSLSTPAHVARQYCELATRLGIFCDGKGYRLKVRSDWKNRAEELLEKAKITLKWRDDAPLLLIAPGGRHNTKIVPHKKWIELLNLARKSGYEKIGLIGSKDDVVQAMKVTDQLEFAVANFAGKTSPGELLALISMSALLFSGDSGPMHLAAGLDVPVVSIFGPTVPEFGFAPLAKYGKVLQVEGLPCRPCHPHGPVKCPKGHFRCMQDISMSETLTAGIELIARGKAG